MKKLINLILVISVFITNLIYIDVDAKTTEITATVNDSEGVFLRTGPGTNYDREVLLSYGKTVLLVSTEKYDGEGCNGWYKVNYNGKERYICSEFVSVKTTTYEDSYYTTSSWNARINEDYATVRKSPNGTMIERIYLGTDVKVLETSGDWAKISYYDNRTGYILKRLVSKYEDITSVDEEYYKILREAGFPENYLPFLTYLHKKYPNWVFKADDTKKKFNTVVNNELGKNYIQSNESSYRYSNKVKENPNWYAASLPVVAFFIDPTNYLTEINIFAFEELTYDKDGHTKEMIREVFDGTYLDTDEYAGYFLQAAEKYNVSPVHLATRVEQEGGAKSTYAAITGTATSVSKLKYRDNDLDGVYNYYNIGSYEDDYTDSSVTRGLAAAKGLVDKNEGTPWDTREKAIIYGAKFIADGYISKKQNTLYYQKFNTAYKASYASYTHQYMTNITAPLSESLSTFETYKEIYGDTFTNTSFTFLIPVYQDMPSGFTSHPIIGDTNANLSDIKINGKSIEGFDSDVLEYVYYIDNDTKEVEITLTGESTKSSFIGEEKIEIPSDVEEMDVLLKVTSESGIVKIYKVTFIKTKQEEIPEEQISVEQVLSNVDVKIDETFMSGIKEETTTTTLNNSITKEYPNVSVKITDNEGNGTTGNLKTGDKITIKTNSEEKTYTIVIKGDTNGDGKISTLDLLRVQKHILSYSKLTDEYLEACDTNYDGKVNTLDLLRVQKHILNYIELK